MILIVILLAMLLERLLTQFASWRNSRWFTPWIRSLDALCDSMKLETGWVRVAVILSPLCGLFWWLQLLPGYRYQVLIDLLVLVLTLGPRDLGSQVHTYLQAEKSEDRVSATKAAKELIGGEVPKDADGRRKALVNNLFIRASERVVALLFWFVVLGPTGAMLFRLTCAATGSSNAQTAATGRRLRGWLSWLPSHIMATAYLLTGNFDRAWGAWKTHARRYWKHTLALRLDDANHRLLARVGQAAMQGDTNVERSAPEAVERAAKLIGRADWLVLAALAGATLLGWVI